MMLMRKVKGYARVRLDYRMRQVKCQRVLVLWSEKWVRYRVLDSGEGDLVE